jgi:hypothetical protein
MRFKAQNKAQSLQDATAVYTIRNVDGTPSTYGENNEFTEHLLLRYYTAPEIEKVRRRQQDRLFKKMRGGRNAMPSAAESEENRIEELTAAVAGGKVFDLDSEKEMEVTPEIAKLLLTADLDLRDEIGRWINDGQNFLQS